MKDACKAVGIDYLSTHKVRAWAATEAAKRGMDEVTLIRTFGWADIDTAKSYIRIARSESAQKEVMEDIFKF
ncbi:MAG: tyrosine-type recombinase/integrase [Lachnospiraceae bacterium]|nr:tyrosine-type recombinase/integrase [Lachnospiraceae bacterium]